MANRPSSVPPSPVNPAHLLQDEARNSVGSICVRRNASRSCRRVINYSDDPLEEDTVNPDHASEKPETKFHWKTSRRLRSTVKFDTLDVCRFCENPFNSLREVEVHESSCSSAPTGTCRSIRLEEPSSSWSQDDFMSGLGMQRVGIQPSTSIPTSIRHSTSVQPPILKNEKKLGSKRFGPAGQYFLNNREVSICSQRGLDKNKELGGALSVDPQQCINKYEKFCRRPNDDEENIIDTDETKTWPTKISKKMVFKENEHVHEYRFNRAERIKKINVAAIGLDPKHFSLLNKMKPASITMRRMKDNEIAIGVASSSCIAKYSSPESPTMPNLQKQASFVLKQCEIMLVDISDTEEGQRISFANAKASSPETALPATTVSPASTSAEIACEAVTVTNEMTTVTRRYLRTRPPTSTDRVCPGSSAYNEFIACQTFNNL